ncbi:MAG: TonB-dependent receptor [Sphingobium sp.]|uniref:energy transducer TonB family protein n=1 Tax=Sphingobium sp. CECT 9361 TaxID=2845384 RepID=UPI001E6362B6|nr:energy transducer TonB [Sphingobium sp. CECT 9361]CAH0348270.1 hypothetical protein SPH9361_00015 [Sphingobium sp. CECT 9361]
MAALTIGGDDPLRSRKRPVVTPGRLAAAGGIAVALWLVWTLINAQIVTERPNEMKTTQVVLPPPPVPPKPPEAKPQDKPIEPKEAPPLDQPQDTPPPPNQAPSQADASAGDSALTAREGAGPSNYGLAAGNGSGTRIGTRAGNGDNGYGFYAGLATSAIRLATQSDRGLARGRYSVRLLVTVDAQGRITDVRILDGSGDSRRDDRLRQVLGGLQLSRRPPDGLPAMRIELNSRPGA